MDRPVKVAEIETPLEQFTYWLERDWPRDIELKWLELRRADDPAANPAYERKWRVRMHLARAGGAVLPVLTIVAESMTPGSVQVAWGVDFPAKFAEGVTPPIEAVAEWMHFRFRAEVIDPDEDESATVSYARAPLVIETEAELKTAINSIDTRPGKPAWWAAVAELDDAHKRANPKYTYRELAELLGFEEKHTGRMVRKHRPKTHQNTPKQRPKSG